MILDRITGYYRINKLVIVNNKNELETPLSGGDAGVGSMPVSIKNSRSSDLKRN